MLDSLAGRGCRRTHPNPAPVNADMPRQRDMQPRCQLDTQLIHDLALDMRQGHTLRQRRRPRSAHG